MANYYGKHFKPKSMHSYGHSEWPTLSNLYNSTTRLEDDSYGDPVTGYDNNVDTSTEPYGAYKFFMVPREDFVLAPEPMLYYRNGHKQEEDESSDSTKGKSSVSYCKVMLCVFLIVSFIAVTVAAIVLAVIMTQSSKPKTFLATDSLQAKRTLLGEASLDRNFNPNLTDITSNEFKELEKEFCTAMKNLFSSADSPIKEADLDCTVLKFSKGSTKVLFQIEFKTNVDVTPENLEDFVKTKTKETKGNVGKIFLEMMFLHFKNKESSTKAKIESVSPSESSSATEKITKNPHLDEVKSPIVSESFSGKPDVSRSSEINISKEVQETFEVGKSSISLLLSLQSESKTLTSSSSLPDYLTDQNIADQIDDIFNELDFTDMDSNIVPIIYSPEHVSSEKQNISSNIPYIHHQSILGSMASNQTSLLTAIHVKSTNKQEEKATTHSISNETFSPEPVLDIYKTSLPTEMISLLYQKISKRPILPSVQQSIESSNTFSFDIQPTATLETAQFTLLASEYQMSLLKTLSGNFVESSQEKNSELVNTKYLLKDPKETRSQIESKNVTSVLMASSVLTTLEINHSNTEQIHSDVYQKKSEIYFTKSLESSHENERIYQLNSITELESETVLSSDFSTQVFTMQDKPKSDTGASFSTITPFLTLSSTLFTNLLPSDAKLSTAYNKVYTTKPSLLQTSTMRSSNGYSEMYIPSSSLASFAVELQNQSITLNQTSKNTLGHSFKLETSQSIRSSFSNQESLNSFQIIPTSDKMMHSMDQLALIDVNSEFTTYFDVSTVDRNIGKRENLTSFPETSAQTDHFPSIEYNTGNKTEVLNLLSSFDYNTEIIKTNILNSSVPADGSWNNITASSSKATENRIKNSTPPFLAEIHSFQDTGMENNFSTTAIYLTHAYVRKHSISNIATAPEYFIGSMEISTAYLESTVSHINSSLVPDLNTTELKLTNSHTSDIQPSSVVTRKTLNSDIHQLKSLSYSFDTMLRKNIIDQSDKISSSFHSNIYEKNSQHQLNLSSFSETLIATYNYSNNLASTTLSTIPEIYSKNHSGLKEKNMDMQATANENMFSDLNLDQNPATSDKFELNNALVKSDISRVHLPESMNLFNDLSISSLQKTTVHALSTEQYFDSSSSVNYKSNISSVSELKGDDIYQSENAMVENKFSSTAVMTSVLSFEEHEKFSGHSLGGNDKSFNMKVTITETPIYSLNNILSNTNLTSEFSYANISKSSLYTLYSTELTKEDIFDFSKNMTLK